MYRRFPAIETSASNARIVASSEGLWALQRRFVCSEWPEKSEGLLHSSECHRSTRCSGAVCSSDVLRFLGNLLLNRADRIVTPASLKLNIFRKSSRSSKFVEIHPSKPRFIRYLQKLVKISSKNGFWTSSHHRVFGYHRGRINQRSRTVPEQKSKTLHLYSDRD